MAKPKTNGQAGASRIPVPPSLEKLKEIQAVSVVRINGEWRLVEMKISHGVVTDWNLSQGDVLRVIMDKAELFMSRLSYGRTQVVNDERP